MSEVPTRNITAHPAGLWSIMGSKEFTNLAGKGLVVCGHTSRGVLGEAIATLHCYNFGYTLT